MNACTLKIYGSSGWWTYLHIPMSIPNDSFGIETPLLPKLNIKSITIITILIMGTIVNLIDSRVLIFP